LGARAHGPRFPSCTVFFLNGKEEPEFALADNPAAGQLLRNDVIEYKIRHIWMTAVTEWRYAIKNIVP
jgi:hypothetical protein